MDDIRINVNGDIAAIYTPYNAQFVAAIKGIGGASWNKDRRAWEIPASAVPAAREVMRSVYGRDDQPIAATDLISLRIATAEEVWVSHGDVILFGKTLSHATGRDSGSRPGNDVAFVKGAPASAGSVKNWHSSVPAGSEIILTNVPRALYDRTKDALPDGVTAEVIAATAVDKAALRAERERLMARIAEIDAALKD